MAGTCKPFSGSQYWLQLFTQSIAARGTLVVCVKSR
jgi:hypothetical protein